MENNQLTLFAVKYRDWGADKPYEKYFYTEEAANEFYQSRDHVDPPRRLAISGDDEIQRYRELIAYQD